MNIDKWWNEYISKPIAEQYDFIKNTFEEGLTPQFFKKIDVVDVILETKGQLENAKKFDKILEFTKLLQTKYPKLYKENFHYIDKTLIDYYCYHNQKENLLQPVNNFIDEPVQGIDDYLVCFKKLLFYKHNDLVERIIEETYESIENSPSLIGGAGYDLAIAKFYLVLEEFYNLGSSEGIDRKKFRDTLKRFDFKFEEDFIKAVDKGLASKIITGDEAIQRFIKDRKNFIITLEVYFLRYMAEKDFTYALSGRIWDNMLKCWSKYSSSNHQKPNEYFTIDLKEFEEYLISLLGGIFVDNKFETIATLWGSFYIYDFLKSIDIIDAGVYENFIKNAYFLKGQTITAFPKYLWKSTFVHSWNKPDSISKKEFEAEANIFIKSYSFKSRKFTRFKTLISDEMEIIKEVSDFKNEFISGLTRQKHTSKKVGRNEPCPCGSGKKYKKCCGKIV